jgi:hypothetical protein
MKFIVKTLLFLLPTAFQIGRQRLDTAQLPHDQESLNALYTAVRRWCILNEFLITTADGSRLVPNIAKPGMDNKIRTFIYEANFKRLNVRSRLNIALALFKDTEFDNTTSRLIDLHIRLLTELDSRFLNLYINKLHHGLMAFYPETEESAEVVPWEEVFAKYPFFWLLFPIQQLMRDCAVPLPR